MGQISKKWYVKKHCSCHTAHQFAALHGTPFQNYLGKPTNENKHVNKQERLFIHHTSPLCVEKKKNSCTAVARGGFIRRCSFKIC